MEFDRNKGMTFINAKYVDTMASYTIAKMIDLHSSDISKDKTLLRDIIFGFNKNKNSFYAHYSQNLYYRYHDFTINPTDIIVSNQLIKITDNDSKSKGMKFYKEEIHQKSRLYVDDYIVHILDTLIIISDEIIEFKYIINMIIYEWLDKITKHNLKLDADSIHYITNKGYGDNAIINYHYYFVPIQKNLWDKLKYMGRTRKLKISEIFVEALIEFLQNRYELINNY